MKHVIFLNMLSLILLTGCLESYSTTRVRKAASSSSSLTLDFPFVDANASKTVTVMGACDTGSSLVIKEGSTSLGSLTCTGGVYRSKLNLLSGSGAITINVVQTDPSSVVDTASVNINKISPCSVKNATINPTPFITLNPNTMPIETWDNSGVGNPQYDGSFLFGFNSRNSQIVNFPTTGYYSFKVKAKHYTGSPGSFTTTPRVQISVDGRVAMESDVSNMDPLVTFDMAHSSGVNEVETFQITAGNHLVSVGSGNWNKVVGASTYQNLIVGDITIHAATLTCASIPTNQDLSGVTIKSMANARKLRIGVDLDTGISIPGGYSGNPFLTDPLYANYLKNNFNHLTPGSAFLMNRIAPSEGVWDFTEADDIVDFAVTHNLSLTFGHLLWHQDYPTWLNAKTPLEVKTFVETYITTVMNRYKGKIKYWVVVNEPLSDSEGMRSSIWLTKLGSDYIKDAFIKAHAVDPDAVLLFNDYDIDELGRKADAAYELISDLLLLNVPIHVVGFQGHVKIDRPLLYKSMVANFNRFKNLGLKIQVSEYDVGISSPSTPTATDLKVQAQYYRNGLKACLEFTECELFTIFGTVDKYWWGPQLSPPLYYGAFLNDDYSAKPAYTSILHVLYGIDL